MKKMTYLAFQQSIMKYETYWYRRLTVAPLWMAFPDEKPRTTDQTTLFSTVTVI